MAALTSLPGPEVAVCICTKGRNAELVRALDSIGRQTWFLGGGKGVVVVVDNNREPLAREVVEGWSERTGMVAVYRHTPIRNLSVVRNVALRTAKEVAPFAALIDDDEVATPRWIERLMATQQRTSASLVTGPVRPSFPPSAPDWAVRSRAFHLAEYGEGCRLHDGITGNALLDLDVLWDHELQFDESLGRSGGEDQLFFRSAAAAGLEIRFSAEAVVTELVPVSRLRPRWMLMREYRKGNTLGWIARRRPALGEGGLRRLGASGKWFAMGLVHVIKGTLRHSPADLLDGALEVARASGMIVGLLGRSPDVYGR